MKKLKVTYNECGVVKAKIVMADWYNVIGITGIQENNIIKIELILEATEVENLTENA